MFIDSHCHIFPDKIAVKAISKLANLIHIEPSMSGTYTGLQDSMEKGEVDISVVLPPVTDPHQYDSIIRFADQINEEFYKHPTWGIFSLAGIHPDNDNYAEKLKQIKSMGFPGVKIHPDYQDTLFNDIKYKRILDKASELDLYVVTHAGYDPYSPVTVHCTVPMIVEVLDEVAPAKLVLAHMGNNEFYDDVEAQLLGRDVYLDTAYSIQQLPTERLRSMIQRHGADKVLFGTDAPWTRQKKDVEKLTQLGLSDEELALVSHKNALKLLKL